MTPYIGLSFENDLFYWRYTYQQFNLLPHYQLQDCIIAWKTNLFYFFSPKAFYFCFSICLLCTLKLTILPLSRLLLTLCYSRQCITLTARTVSNTHQRTTVDKSLSIVSSFGFFFLHLLPHLNFKQKVNALCSSSLTNDCFVLLFCFAVVERAQMISCMRETWRGYFFFFSFANVKQWMHVFINNRM